jgi:MspA
MSVTMAPTAGGDPEVEPAAATAANDPRVPSNPPATVNTPDGWILGLGAKDEMQVPVAPLTTAVSSREYLASGTFVGSLRGPEQPQGLLEVGYEIGCGIDMSTSNGVDIGGNTGLAPSLGFTGPFAGVPGNFLPVISAPVGGSINVGLKPGFVIVVPVTKKQFKGANPWVMISNFHVKIDGCVGQSFIRSYATLTRVTDLSDVVLSYVGTTKAV